MKLVDLEPEWTSSVHSLDHPNGPQLDGRRRVGTAMFCLCPCGCGSGTIVPFANPLDGGPPDPAGAWGAGNTSRWSRVGDTFESLTITPSIVLWENQEQGIQHWHGYLTNGEMVQA